jgi:hypothetical protein
MRTSRRGTPGRPHKFGRPAKLVQLTLPEDVLQRLGEIHQDVAWAIVTLCERATRSDAVRPMPVPTVELVQLPKCGGLILFKPESLREIQGVSTIPLADGRALVALDAGGGIADLELAIVERLEEQDLPAHYRRELQETRDTLRAWRRSTNVSFQSRSIIVARRSRRTQSAKPSPASKPVRSSSRRMAPWITLRSWWHPLHVAAVSELLEIATATSELTVRLSRYVA